MGDPLGASQLLQRALELLPERSPRRAQALVELAAAAWNLLPREETRSLLVAASELAAELGLRSLELRVWLLQMAESDEASEAYPTELAAAVRELELLDDPRALAAGLTAQAENHCSLGNAGAAVVASRRALDILRAIGQDTVWALAALIWAVREAPMPVHEGEDLLAELMDELGMRPTVRAELVQGQALLAQLAGRDGDARALLASAREIERDLGRVESWRLDETEGLVLLRSGGYQPARDLFAHMVAGMEERDNAWEAALARSRLAFIEARHGNLVTARELATSLLVAAPDAGGFEAQARALIAVSEVAAAEGDAAQALQFAREAATVTGAGDWVLLEADARMQLAGALRLAGDSGDAAASASAAAALCRAKGFAAGVVEAEALVRSLTALA